jgi:hypothetical protein
MVNKFNVETVFGVAPLLEVLQTLLNQKFDSISDVFELIETQEHCTYGSEYVSQLSNRDKKELVDLVEYAVDRNVEFILDIALCDLCLVLGSDGCDLHIDVSDVDREELHFNYMKIYNKYRTSNEE